MFHHIKHHATRIKHHVKKHKHIYIPGILATTIALTAIISLILLNSTSALSNGQNAIDVIGQRDGIDNALPFYTSSSLNNAPNSKGFNSPSGIALDSVDHRLFVADTSNNRVLVYNLDANNELLDNKPDYVLGQPNFKTSAQATCAGSKSYLYLPGSLAYDSAKKRLFVDSESINFNRVAIFDVATITNGEPYLKYFGSNCADGLTAVTPSTLYYTRHLTFNHDFSRLFVAEQWNNRITVFDTSMATNVMTDGADAINVLGQDTFTTKTSSCAANKLTPYGLAYYHREGDDDLLFATDHSRYRVLVFGVDEITNGENAVNVLGQPDFTTCTIARDQNSFGQSRGMAISGNSLYIADSTDNRIMEFNIADGITNNESAINLIGQTSWTNYNTALTQSGFNQPEALVINPSNSSMYVVDDGNNRILVFDGTELSKASTEEKFASNVLGQTMDGTTITYTKNGASDQINNDGFYYPEKTLLDANDHRLFVADGTNHRILVFNLDTNNNPLDYNADFVLGQPDFKTNTVALTQSGLSYPSGLAYDPARKYLFVSDSTYSSNVSNRVLVFDVNAISNGENAVNVLGQEGFTSNLTTYLNTPTGLAYDSDRNYLFVTNYSYDRVEIYDLNEITNGELIINYIGTAPWNQIPPTQQSLNAPSDVAYDPEDKKLFVADSSNNRILRYDVTTLSDSPNADAVLGQTDYITRTSGVTQSKMNSPIGLSFDTERNYLFASDRWNNRVLVFNLNDGITNGENALNVIGQTTWTASSLGTAQNRLNGPKGMDFDAVSKKLYITENNNQRVVIHPTTTPTISAAANPVYGSTSGGGNTTITGTDYSVGAKVKIDTTECSSTIRVSSTELTCVGIPAHSAGTFGVTVVNGDGAIVTRASSYTYYSQPTISSISPTSGTTSGGTQITIYGSNFQFGNTTVLVDRDDCTSVNVATTSRLTCYIPAHVAGIVDITVTTLGGTSTTHADTKFTFATPPPTIDWNGISPNSSTEAGGIVATITGSNFTDATVVQIGATDCTAFTVINDNTIECTIPAGTGAQTLYIETPSGDSSAGDPVTFTYYGMPIITDFTPNSGYEVGGDAVTINGRGFGDDTTVHFGANEAIVNFWNSTETVLYVEVPAGTPNTNVDVTVTNPGNQTATAAQQYSYLQSTPDIQITDDTETQDYPSIIKTSDGHYIMVWADLRNGNDFDIYAQKYNTTTDSVDWTVNGIAVIEGIGSQPTYYLYQPELIADTNGGAYLAWDTFMGVDGESGDREIFVQHLDANGNKWASAVNVSDNPSFDDNKPKMINDGSGGLYITWEAGDTSSWPFHFDVGLSRLNSSGNIVAGWSGKTVDNDIDPFGDGIDRASPQIIPSTTAGSFYIAYYPDPLGVGNGGIAAVKYDSSGSFVSPWDNPVILSEMENGNFGPEPIGDGEYIVMADGNDGLYTVYVSYDALWNQNLYASHLNSNAVHDPNFGTWDGNNENFDGLFVSSLISSEIVATVDDYGNIYVVEGGGGEVVNSSYGQIIFANGSILDSELSLGLHDFSNYHRNSIVSAGTNGAIFAGRDGLYIQVTQINPDGSMGATSNFGQGTVGDTRAMIAGDTSAAIVWIADADIQGDGTEVYMQLFDADTAPLIPMISNISPSTGFIAGGTAVTITGYNFINNANTTATIGGVACTISNITATTIACTTGAHAVGTVNVNVTTDNGGAIMTNGYTYTEPPVACYTAAGAGDPLANGNYELAGDNNGPYYINENVYYLFFHSRGGLYVIDDNAPNGNDPLYYNIDFDLFPATGDWDMVEGIGPAPIVTECLGSPPTITGVDPDHGSVAGATDVTITGTGFIDGDTTVIFDPGGLQGAEVPCANVAVANATTLTCTTGAHVAALVDVQITTSNGSSGVATYTYEAGGGLCPANQDGDDNVTLSDVSPSYMVDSKVKGKIVTVNPNAPSPKLDISALSTTSGANKVVQIPMFDITTPETRLIIQQCSVITTINGANTWDQTFKVPKAISPATLSQAALDTLGVTVDRIESVITIGDSAHDMTLTSPLGYAGLQLFNMANKSVAYINAAGAVKKITKACGGSVATALQEDFADQSGAGGMCYANGGVGNADLILYTRHFTDIIVYNPDEAPSVLDVSVHEGYFEGDTGLLIYGTNFGTGAAVTFDGLATDPIRTHVIDNNTIFAYTPDHSAEIVPDPFPVDIVVTNDPGGPNEMSGTLLSTHPNHFQYESGPFADGPGLESIFPGSGPAEGGTEVSFAGSGFIDADTAFYLDNLTYLVTGLTFTDIHNMDGLTPAHTAGTVGVIAMNLDGQADYLPPSVGFEYLRGAAGECGPAGLGIQCGQLQLGCNSTSPSLTVTPAAAFTFYPDGTAGTIYSTNSVQNAFNNPSGSGLSTVSGTDYIEINDLRDASQEGCNEGLNLVLHVLDPGTDGRYFDNGVAGSIPLTGTYVLTNSDTCPAGFTEKGGDVCFKDDARCGDTDGNPSIVCDGQQGGTIANYDGTGFASIGNYNVALGSAENTPVDRSVLTFSDNAELFGQAGIGVSYGLNIPAGQASGTYTLNLEYVLTGM